MASPSQSKRTYHVFLSFRGLDTRDNIVSHLYDALNRVGVHTYIDSKELQKGERISKALMNAIEDSRIGLIVFSENYASSIWCLDEVVKIMECKKTNNLSVLPVFYKVDPREVRTGRTSYSKAFENHRKKCEGGAPVGFNLADVTKWKDALLEAGSLSGWTYSKGSEAQLVRDIVEDISRRLERIPLDISKYSSGTLSRVKDLISILKMGSEDKAQDESLTIGLWAMGGMGKTVLAIILYNSIFENFEYAAFLDDISSDSKNLKHLQERLLFKLTNTDIRVINRREGITAIKQRLCGKRVLLILDGVSDMSQIDALAEAPDWFGKGSRIVITTRIKGVLSRTKAIYEVEPLEENEARELFLTYASENKDEKIGGNLVDSALQCTQRLPLALEKLGSAFRGKSEYDRRDALKNFTSRSQQTIHDVLKESLNGLDGIPREIFLDIACFFNGWSRKYVESLLGSCYDVGGYDDGSWCDAAASIVNDLIERSLIRDENGTLQVHGLVELMGQKIADHHHHLMKRSRLWQIDEVVKVLSRDTGQYDVEAIVLAPTQPKEIKIVYNSFAKLIKLRFLIMINVKTNFPGTINLPDQLRWFEWPECPASCLRFSSTPLNPAVLAVRKSLLVKKRGEP